MADFTGNDKIDNLKILNIAELQWVMSLVNVGKQKLDRLGIILDNHGYMSYNWEKCDYIQKAAKGPFGEYSLDFKEKLALALAVTEEERNNHIDDQDIDFINRFFNVDITRSDISKLHSKYI